MTNKEAYLILNLLPYIGPVVGHRLLLIVDEAKSIFLLSKNDLLQKIKLNSKQLNSLLNWKDIVDLEREKRSLIKSKVHLITFDNEYYPKNLKEIYDPPICFYAQGNLELLKEGRHNFAVVGSRRCTNYGCMVTKKFVQSMVNCDWVIISGLALGIDTVAHKQALSYPSGKTIAILGSGLGNIYPAENIILVQEILNKSGLIISEFPLLKRPDKNTFPMRNRLISGLSMGVLIIEGGLNSGSLITAHMAADQGKQVFAIPGNIDKFSSQGCHKLIKNGACMVTCFDDILNEYENIELNFKIDKEETKSLQYNLQLSDLEESIIKFIGLEGEVSFDEILLEMNEEVGNMFAVLIKLEVKKLVCSLPSRMYSLSDYIKKKL